MSKTTGAKVSKIKKSNYYYDDFNKKRIRKVLKQIMKTKDPFQNWKLEKSHFFP